MQINVVAGSLACLVFQTIVILMCSFRYEFETFVSFCYVIHTSANLFWF